MRPQPPGAPRETDFATFLGGVQDSLPAPLYRMGLPFSAHNPEPVTYSVGYWAETRQLVAFQEGGGTPINRRTFILAERISEDTAGRAIASTPRDTDVASIYSAVQREIQHRQEL